MSDDSRHPQTLITAFVVAPTEDDRFVAAWERAREALGGEVSTLHRALRSDVALRFVDIAEADAAPVWRDAIALVGATAATATHSAAYDVVREDGRPEGEGGIVAIEAFEVPDRGQEALLAASDAIRQAVAGLQGYIGSRLHRSTEPAAFPFMAVARWSSPLMVARARQRPEVQDATAAMPFRSHAALYAVVRS